MRPFYFISLFFLFDFTPVKISISPPPPDRAWALIGASDPVETEAILPPRRSSAYSALLERVAESERVPVGILESIAYAESRFKPWAQSPARKDGTRDLGMFQINEKYLDWFSAAYNRGKPFDPFDPHQASVIAARHIRNLYRQFGKWELVVLAYNSGEAKVRRNTVPDSSYRYLRKVFRQD